VCVLRVVYTRFLIIYLINDFSDEGNRGDTEKKMSGTNTAR